MQIHQYGNNSRLGGFFMDKLYMYITLGHCQCTWIYNCVEHFCKAECGLVHTLFVIQFNIFRDPNQPLDLCTTKLQVCFIVLFINCSNNHEHKYQCKSSSETKCSSSVTFTMCVSFTTYKLLCHLRIETPEPKNTIIQFLTSNITIFYIC